MRWRIFNIDIPIPNVLGCDPNDIGGQCAWNNVALLAGASALVLGVLMLGRNK